MPRLSFVSLSAFLLLNVFRVLLSFASSSLPLSGRSVFPVPEASASPGPPQALSQQWWDGSSMSASHRSPSRLAQRGCPLPSLGNRRGRLTSAPGPGLVGSPYDPVPGFLPPPPGFELDSGWVGAHHASQFNPSCHLPSEMQTMYPCVQGGLGSLQWDRQAPHVPWRPSQKVLQLAGRRPTGSLA